MSLILEFADSIDVDCIFLFDNEFFSSCSQLSQMVKKLHGTLQYADHYQNYIMIFDLDSIACPIYDVSGLSSKAEVSSAALMKMLEKNLVYQNKYLNQELLYECLRVISFRWLTQQNQNKWIISITQNVHLSIDYKQRVKWPKSFYVRQYQAQLQKKTIKRNCKRCGNLLSQIDNQQTSDCRMHKEELGLYIRQKKKQQNRMDREEYRHISRSNMKRSQNLQEIPKHIKIITLQQVKQLFKQRIDFNPDDIIWVCCRTSYSSKGCIQVSHDLQEIKLEDDY